MVKLYDGGAYLVNGTEIVPESEAAKVESLTGKKANKDEAKKEPSLTVLWKHIIHQEIWITLKLSLMRWLPMILPSLESFRQQKHQEWKSSHYHMF